MAYYKKYTKYKSKYLKSRVKQFGGTGSFNLDEEMTKEMNLLKTISFDDLSGLHMRVYERDGKDINDICFIPPKIDEYIGKFGNMDIVKYVETKLANIKLTPMKDIYFDFGTDKDKVKLAFADNWEKNDKRFIEINLPIKFVDLIHKIFDHFDEVGLVGYPDNGGIDRITYDKGDGVYKVGTWS
jgi:hypothetical protein